MIILISNTIYIEKGFPISMVILTYTYTGLKVSLPFTTFTLN